MEISEKILYLFILLNFYTLLSYNYATAGGRIAGQRRRKTPCAAEKGFFGLVLTITANKAAHRRRSPTHDIHHTTHASPALLHREKRTAACIAYLFPDTAKYGFSANWRNGVDDESNAAFHTYFTQAN